MEQLKIIKEQMNNRLRKQSMEKNLIKEAKQEMNQIVKKHKNNEWNNYLDKREGLISLNVDNQLFIGLREINLWLKWFSF